MLLAEDRVTLQRNINLLSAYCDNWNLTVNPSKSKIMVFRKGGRLAAAEKWQYRGLPIEVVKTYKYLGVTLSSSLSLTYHFRDRISAAKMGLNRNWSSFIAQDLIPLSAKKQIFDAILRSIVCYAAQVWGFQRYDILEKFQRFFIKKLFSLPQNTPNNMIYLETATDPLEVYTLQLHFKYCLKLLQLSECRLSSIIAIEIIKRNTFWFQNWCDLADRYSCRFDRSLESISLWKDQLAELRSAIVRQHWEQCKEAASNSNRFLLYKELDHDVKILKFVDGCSWDLTGRELRWMFKLRCELLHLNYTPWLERENSDCPLCNLPIREDLFHFLAQCSALHEIRSKFLGTSPVRGEYLIFLLNAPSAKECRKIVNFARHAWTRRYNLIHPT